MEKLMVGLAAIIAGCALIVFRRKFVHDSLAFQNKAFGFHFGKKEMGAGKRSTLIIGLAFILVGFMILLGVVG